MTLGDLFLKSLMLFGGVMDFWLLKLGVFFGIFFDCIISWEILLSCCRRNKLLAATVVVLKH